MGESAAMAQGALAAAAKEAQGDSMTENRTADKNTRADEENRAGKDRRDRDGRSIDARDQNRRAQSRENQNGKAQSREDQGAGTGAGGETANAKRTGIGEAERYLDEIPRFSVRKHSLDDIRAMMEVLGLSQDGVRFIHVAGTNGKGSVCAFLASVLREAGEHTAVFTSPHLVSVRERFCFDGQEAEPEEFLRAFCRVADGIDALKERGLSHPSYFEFLFLMFLAMLEERPGFTAVVETGLGGRLDATNVVENPAVCVITSISLDHMEYLGNTVEQIAGEKAGIIKPGIPVIYDGTDERAAAVIAAKAGELGSPAYSVGEESFCGLRREKGHLFLTEKRETSGAGCSFPEPDPEDELEIPFAARYQAVNAMLAVRAAELLEIPREAVKRGIRRASWPGRMEEIAPGVYLDGAHNEGGIRAFARAASELSGKQKILLFAVVSDKEYEEMADILLREFAPDVLILTQISYRRGLDIGDLERAAVRAAKKAGGGPRLLVRPSVEEAFALALEEKGEEDTVFCAGSLYLIGEIKDVIRRNHYGERQQYHD